ncbi:MAG: hypothetical protein B9S34_07175 [Opitutia bacterium Tous-C1TDCM]|nr:MAG: hypothetical protein B9S34_07175 [Opitutae bacterium Tous-C1TDCM]
MPTDPAAGMTPRILLVDDERQIFAAVRLRLGRDYELCHRTDAASALACIRTDRFDLCFVDIHMPGKDGLTFIAEAQEVDPQLGFVVISAFDTAENLRRAIPLQVYAFIGKPLPDKAGFEGKVPEWIERTRRCRHDQGLARRADAIATDLASARMAQEIEFVASESARDALQQTANLLTTIQALLVSATSTLGQRARGDATLATSMRNLEQARRTADAAMIVSAGFFDSAYGNRDTSPALIGSGVRHALEIARRISRADEDEKVADCTGLDEFTAIRGLSGIEFLLLMVCAQTVALNRARPRSTVGLHAAPLARLEHVTRENSSRPCAWLNRKHVLSSQPGIQFTITADAPAMSRTEFEAWLQGELSSLRGVPAHGLVMGIQKSRGLLGLATAPQADGFRLVIALPV